MWSFGCIIHELIQYFTDNSVNMKQKFFVFHNEFEFFSTNQLVQPLWLNPPIVTKNGIIVQGKSNGKSLIILPRQFSNCYSFVNPSGAFVKLVRVNGFQLGIIFDGEINGEIKFEVPLFSDLGCRDADALQSKLFKLAPVTKKEPKFGFVGEYLLKPAQDRGVARSMSRGMKWLDEKNSIVHK
jgi:hypothetical protein